MRTVKDKFFVSADADANRCLDIIGPDGKKLFVDTDFNPFAYSTRIGAVTHIPQIIDDQWLNDNPIKVGDTVVFHHHVCQKENRVEYEGEEIFMADYSQLFAKVEDGIITPLETVIYVEPIIEKEEELFCDKFKIKEEVEVKKMVGIAAFTSNKAQETGIELGDKIYFTAYAHYKTDLLGKEYYRIRLRNIRLVERGGELVFIDNMVVLNDNHEVIGLGNNITDIEIGDKVNYFEGVFAKVNYSGKMLMSLKRENINVIL